MCVCVCVWGGGGGGYKNHSMGEKCVCLSFPGERKVIFENLWCHVATRMCVCVCVCCVVLTSYSATTIWLSNGNERVGGEDEAVKGPGKEPSHQRAHPVDVVVSPGVVVLGGDSGWSETPGWVERASCEGVAGEEPGERRVLH